MLGAYARDATLAGSGVTIEARVTGYVPAPEIHEDTTRVHYSFTTPQGEQVDGSRNQWRWQVDDIRKTGKVPVTYLPDNPAFQHMDNSFDLDAALAMIGQYLAIFCVGVWAAGRNLGLWGRARGGTEPAVLPDSMPRAEFLRTTQRPTFGRRGL
jgi:hypothetical protein